MSARLYTVRLSHPGRCARLMLEQKGIDHRVTVMPEGTHPLLLRLAGFRGYTVPALKIEGEKVQGSLEIAEALERLRPDPPLYPADGPARSRVMDAECWAEAELQPLSRRIFRWAMTEQLEVRRWVAEGTLTRDDPNAATLQAGTSVRALSLFRQLQPLLADRPCGDLARALLPEWPESPVLLPAEWLPPGV